MRNYPDYSFDYEGIAKAIKQARQGRGLTQQSLGKAILKSKATISRMESGKQTPYLGDMMAVCWLLDINPMHHFYVGETINKTALMWDDAAIKAGVVAEGQDEVSDDGHVILGGGLRD